MDDFPSILGLPPLPQAKKGDLPKPTVPDVTILFDSDTSTIWQPSTSKSNPLTREDAFAVSTSPLLEHGVHNWYNLKSAGIDRANEHEPESHKERKIESQAEREKMMHVFDMGKEKNTGPHAKEYNPNLYGNVKSLEKTTMPSKGAPLKEATRKAEGFADKVQGAVAIQSYKKFRDFSSPEALQPLYREGKLAGLVNQSAVPNTGVFARVAREQSVLPVSSPGMVRKTADCVAEPNSTPFVTKNNVHVQRYPVDNPFVEYNEVPGKEKNRVSVDLAVEPNKVGEMPLRERVEDSIGRVREVSLPVDYTNQNSEYLYRLIDGQGQQILQLQKVLERLMENMDCSKKTEGCSNIKSSVKEFKKINENFCQCDTHVQGNDEIGKAKAIKTRTVGVNTDFTWSDIVSSLKREVIDTENDAEAGRVENLPQNLCLNNSPANRSCQCRCRNTSRNSRLRRENFNRSQEKTRRRGEFNRGTSSDGTKEINENDSLIEQIKNLALPVTNYENQSPERSINLELKDYKDEMNSLSDDNHSDDAAQSPYFGDSAEIYNRRHYGRKVDKGNIASSEEDNGKTFYNNVMVNIQQFVQQSDRKDILAPGSPNIGEALEEKFIRPGRGNYLPHLQQLKFGENKENFPDPQLEETRQQLLDFGLTFIDPRSIVGGRNPKDLGQFPYDTLLFRDSRNAVQLPTHREMDRRGMQRHKNYDRI